MKLNFCYVLTFASYIFQDKSPTCSKSSGVAKTSKRTKELRLLIYHVSTALFVCECACNACACVCVGGGGAPVCVGAYEQAHAYICVSHSVHRGGNFFLSLFTGVSCKRITGQLVL